MATSTTSTVYIHVIEDVINKVREEFANSGTPNSVLLELQGMWETKLMAAGAVLGPIDRSSAKKPAPAGGPTTVHDLNVPYEGTEEYETPTAEMLFPPTPLQTPMQTPLPGTADSSMYNIPTGLSEYSTPAPENGSGATSDAKAGRPSLYMAPPSPWMNQRQPLDVNVAYVETREEAERGNSQLHATQDFFQPSGKRKRDDLEAEYQTRGFVPQQDGYADAISDAVELEIILGKPLNSSDIVQAGKGKMTPAIEKCSTSRIPQVDGPTTDPHDDMLSTPNIYGVVNEDYNIVNTPAPDLPPATPAVAAPNDVGEDDDDEEPLNENDDDDEVDDVDEGEELNTQHLVLAQFDKVTRTKSRWKCTLKDGIMHINNKDILFNKANGEFDF